MTVVLKRPVIAVAGSSGKTTTKEEASASAIGIKLLKGCVRVYVVKRELEVIKLLW